VLNAQGSTKKKKKDLGTLEHQNLCIASFKISASCITPEQMQDSIQEISTQ
jgi:hypothetical protein